MRELQRQAPMMVLLSLVLSIGEGGGMGGSTETLKVGRPRPKGSHSHQGSKRVKDSTVVSKVGKVR